MTIKENKNMTLQKYTVAYSEIIYNASTLNNKKK